jgi:hypothetical protein
MKSRVTITCQKHKVDFEQDAYSHSIGKIGCPCCKGEKLSLSKRDTKEKFIKKVKKIHGNKFTFVDLVYINNHTAVIITCRTHGNFKVLPTSLLFSRAKCPKCRESKGEEIIRLILEEMHIKYEKEKRFDGCKNITFLPFDFYLPDYNCCIEFDGIQHFVPFSFGGNKTKEELLADLKTVQHRDLIKTKYCLDSNICLLRIPYYHSRKEIQEILNTLPKPILKI